MNWKGWVLTHTVHLGLPILSGLLLAFLATAGRLDRICRRSSVALLVGAFLLGRVLYPVVLYDILGYSGSGDLRLFHDLAAPILRGAVPGREYLCWYGPLLPYVQAAGMLLTPWNPPMGILIPSVLADGIAIVLAARIAGELFGKATARWMAVWLILTPLLWHQLVVRGAEESIFHATLLGGAWLFHRKRPASAAAVLAFGFCCTKVTYAPYALGLLLPYLAAGGRLRAVALAGGGVLVSVYGAWIAAGANPLGFASHPGETLWWFNLASVSWLFPEKIQRSVALLFYAGAILGMATFFGLLKNRGSYLRHAVLATAGIHAVAMLVQPYATANFISQAVALVLFAVLLHPDPRIRVALLLAMALLSVLVAICDSTTLWLYQWATTPLTLAVHASVLVLVLAGLSAKSPPARPEVAPPTRTPVQPGVGAP